jgi:hypothetical protein
MDNVAHLAPAPPAAAPIIPAGTTAAMIAELRQQYNDGKKAYKTYYAVDAALKSQLLQATDDRFVATLKHATHGFALVRTRTIIQHLYNTYGRITAEMMAVNDEKMRSEWDPGTPIEILFTQIDLGQAYATAGNAPYTDTQLVRFGYTNVAANNRMELACRDWRAKPEAEKTWNNFRDDFKRAHLDLRLATTSGSAGYQGNHAQQEVAEEPASNATEAYLVNLADAQIANNAQVTALAATITQLQQQLLAATTAIANVQQSHRHQADNNSNRRNRRNTNNNANNNTTNNERYCWTHGRRSHPSANCRSPADGHQNAATLANRMGGTNRYCPNTAKNG